MQTRVLFAIALLSFCQLALLQSACRLPRYDLTPLILPDVLGTQFYTSSDPYHSYFWNICGTVTSTYCPAQANSAACEITDVTQDELSLGRVNTTLQELNSTSINGVRLQYFDGRTCYDASGDPSRSTTIDIVCDSAVIAQVVSVSQPTLCSYYITMRSRYACPISSTSASLTPTASPHPTATGLSGNSPCSPFAIRSLPTTFSTTITSGLPYRTSCSLTNNPSTYSQWYLVGPVSSTGTVTVSTCGLASFDTIILYYASGSCSSLSTCSYSDDACSYQSSLTINVIAGNYYYFEVRPYSSTISGSASYSVSFTLTATTVSPTTSISRTTSRSASPSASPSASTVRVGATPCTAYPITSVPYTFSNLVVLNGAPYTTSCSLANPTSTDSQWFLVGPTISGTLVAETCGLASFDTVVLAYGTGSCSSLGSCTYSDDVCSTQSRLSRAVSLGYYYYVEVRPYSSSTTNTNSNYSISFSYA